MEDYHSEEESNVAAGEEVENVEKEEALSPSNDDADLSRKNSFVWKYFRALDDSKTYECIICNGCVGNQTSNLARHLAASHNIDNPREQQQSFLGIRSRPSRSFIWKYCTKLDKNHARCHSCSKILSCGGGNTTNIAKHLRRRHPKMLSGGGMDDAIESKHAAAVISQNDTAYDGDDSKFDNATFDNTTSTMLLDRKERKGGSYVWKYCDRLSRNTVRCKLCNKLMSFHGTANVITHLQRRHNILGDKDNLGMGITVKMDVSEENGDDDINNDITMGYRRRRRSAAATSVVWKYCTRISKDAVRCSFCKKNLSYQGTSNLQRHLHRMHGVVTQGRGFVDPAVVEPKWQPLDSEYIWEHCTAIDDEKTKCNMCNDVFDSKDIDEISKHLTFTHALQPQRRWGKRRRRAQGNSEDGFSASYDEYGNDDSMQHDEGDYNDIIIKKDDSIYDDIIEEVHDQTNYDEEPFDPNALNELPLANPLSPGSSRAGSPNMGYRTTINSKKLQRLNEERVRMETEYFREKAGFYRMQKYLSALQAKKVRVELERINSSELPEAAYTVNIGQIQEQITPQ